jgi:hypothetical protein
MHFGATLNQHAPLHHEGWMVSDRGFLSLGCHHCFVVLSFSKKVSMAKSQVYGPLTNWIKKLK